MDKPTGTLQVVGEHEEELAAHALDVFVSIQGSSTFTGRAALTKAKEVATLVQALAAAGLPEQDIDLESVRVEVKNGLLGKSSSANYGLRLHLSNLERIPAVLGAIASVSQATLDRLHWLYPSDEATEGRLLQAATKRALAKARAIAATLEVELRGIAEAHEINHEDVHPHVVTFGAPSMAMRARSAEPAELGLAIQHRKQTKRLVRLIMRTSAADETGATR